MAAATTILGALVMAGGLAYGAYSMSQAGRGKGKGMQPFAMPQAPKVEDAATQAERASRSKRTAMARSKSIYTSPLGIGGEAQITRKTLLGQ